MTRDVNRNLTRNLPEISRWPEILPEFCSRRPENSQILTFSRARNRSSHNQKIPPPIFSKMEIPYDVLLKIFIPSHVFARGEIPLHILLKVTIPRHVYQRVEIPHNLLFEANSFHKLNASWPSVQNSPFCHGPPPNKTPSNISFKSIIPSDVLAENKVIPDILERKIPPDVLLKVVILPDNYL